ncbi:MerR family transcriptional regulator [Paenibacillus soyae]|uniref:MerR family transcriptional regulator n=1 Tax=Paenibacillus soyae TaxID=2969249 RepID=A0A9X2MY30_9BACL|nr:MerR family transcriptional regulator [Paenibacillus soyae]MCR2805572.1 MerR family transcriptional regulator [Paenibacillus soyae]
MFKISEFSRLSRISLQTLRYYDQIGLLKPARIDRSTGYRYYVAEQLLEINRIVIFKDLGFTLQQIAQLLQEDIPTEQIRGMLRLKESEIQQLLENETSKLSRIKERMQLVEREGKMEKEQEAVIKQVEPLHLISYASLGSAEEIPQLFQHFEGLLEASTRSVLSGPRTVLWKESNLQDHDFELEVGYSAKPGSYKLSEGLRTRCMSAETMATLLFRSDSSFSKTACADLAAWIERHGYPIRENQPGREIYVPLSDEPGVCLVEIQIPIMDAGAAE